MLKLLLTKRVIIALVTLVVAVLGALGLSQALTFVCVADSALGINNPECVIQQPVQEEGANDARAISKTTA